MEPTFTIIRVSGEDQLRGYGPDVQWFDDVLPNAPLLGLEVCEERRVIIQEPATGWDREIFQRAVHRALELYQEGKVSALLFPRVDRETRFLFGSFPLLSEVIRLGMKVYFAREKLRLDADDPESVERYLSKATQAQAYVETMRLNTSRGKRRRATQDHKMPTGGRKWAFDYDPATGRYRKNEVRAHWVVSCYQWLLGEGLSLERCCQRLQKEQVATPGWEHWQAALSRGRVCERKPPDAYVWYPTTLRNILLDPANVGKFYAYCHQRVKGSDGKKHSVPTECSSWLLIYEEPEQAIVTPEQYEALKERMQRNRENSRRHTRRSYPPLRSLVFCTLCQRRMIAWTNTHSGIAYYTCQVCQNRLNATRLWQELQGQIKARLLEPERLLPGVKAQIESGEVLSRLEAEEENLARQLEAWSQARDKARRLYFINRDYPEERYLADDRRMVEQEQKTLQELEAVRKHILESRKARMDEEAIRQFCQEVSQNINELSDSQWRLVLERMKVRVMVTPGEAVKVSLALPTAQPEERVIACQLSG